MGDLSGGWWESEFRRYGKPYPKPKPKPKPRPKPKPKPKPKPIPPYRGGRKVIPIPNYKRPRPPKRFI